MITPHPMTSHSHDDMEKTVSDEELVEAAQRGETGAFVELNARYARALLPRVYQITRNWEDAEDVVQDSFLKAFVHINQFEGRSTFSTWITRIAINSALMLLRKRRAIEISFEYEDEESGASRTIEVKDSRRDPEQSYLDNERVEWLNRSILRLKPCLREAIQLKRADGRSTRDIAHKLGITTMATKSRLLRAKEALRLRAF